MESATFSVIFDLDDTLYPESEYALSGFWEVAGYLAERSGSGRNEIFSKLKSDFHQGVRGNNFDRILKQVTVDVDVETLVDVYRTHEPDIELAEDAKDCLENLDGRPLAIITDGETVKQRKKIQALDIECVVDKVYISEEFGAEAGKPSARMFNEFLSETGANSDRSVYIADNPAKDFVAPNDLGMHSIWIDRSWGEYVNEEPTTERQMPTQRIEDLRIVPELLEEWENEL